MYQMTKHEHEDFVTPIRYRDVSFLGLGNHGLVMKAKDAKAGQEVDKKKPKLVAIKKLLHAFSNPENAKWAYREVVILNQMTVENAHKNVIKLLNAYLIPQQNDEEFDVYLVTELMQGTLAIKRNLNRDQLSSSCYQMFCGVNHLHKSGIIHRDLKPENIGVCNIDEIKILDFGLASSRHSVTKTEDVTTPYYRAPEVLLKMNYSAAVDVWSLGCIFAELILGRVLFEGKNSADQWKKMISTLGTPSPEFYDGASPETQKSLKKFPYYFPQSWESILPDSCFPPSKNDKTLTAECARDLISKLLVIDPKERISVRDAISHPYFSHWFSPNELNDPPSPTYDCKIDYKNNSVEDWKRDIFGIVQCYMGCTSEEVPK